MLSYCVAHYCIFPVSNIQTCPFFWLVLVNNDLFSGQYANNFKMYFEVKEILDQYYCKMFSFKVHLYKIIP